MDGAQPNYFTISVAVDGQTLEPSARYFADTVNVAPEQRYDVIWKAREGKTAHPLPYGHHTSNNNVETQGGGGLIMIIKVK